MRFVCFGSFTISEKGDNSVNKLFRIIVSVMLMMLAGMSIAEAASYTVKRGDTLSAIAVAHKTTVKQLVALNSKITNPDRIYIGQVITTSAESEVTANEPASTPAVESIVRKNPRPSTRSTTRPLAPANAATLPPMPSCDTQTAIAKSGLPVHVANLLRDATKDERFNEFVVTTADTRYVFSYTETCVFNVAERTITPGSMPEGIAARRRAGDNPITNPRARIPDLWEEANRETSQTSNDFLWKRPGADKCVKCDLGKFLTEHYPGDVARALNQKVRNDDFEMINIKEHDRFDAMLFGTNKTRTNTVAAWKNGKEERARAYAVTKNRYTYLLIWPEVCGNWASRTVNTVQMTTPIRDTKKEEVLCATCPELRPSYVFPALPEGTPVKDEEMVKFYGVAPNTSHVTTTTNDVPAVTPNPYSAFGSGIDP
jgi:hypothetical protein